MGEGGTALIYVAVKIWHIKRNGKNVKKSQRPIKKLNHKARSKSIIQKDIQDQKVLPHSKLFLGFRACLGRTSETLIKHILLTFSEIY